MTERDELQQWIEDADRITDKVSDRMMDVDLARRVLAELDEAHNTIQRAKDAMWAAHAERFAVERGEITKPDIFYAGVEHSVNRLRPILDQEPQS